jgi:hypothetical protein
MRISRTAMVAGIAVLILTPASVVVSVFADTTAIAEGEPVGGPTTDATATGGGTPNDGSTNGAEPTASTPDESTGEPTPTKTRDPNTPGDGDHGDGDGGGGHHDGDGEPGGDGPGEEQPGQEEPDTGNPDTDNPDMDGPDTDGPDTDGPETDEPDTDKPHTDEPKSDGSKDPGDDEPQAAPKPGAAPAPKPEPEKDGDADGGSTAGGGGHVSSGGQGTAAGPDESREQPDAVRPPVVSGRGSSGSGDDVGPEPTQPAAGWNQPDGDTAVSPTGEVAVPGADPAPSSGTVPGADGPTVGDPGRGSTAVSQVWALRTTTAVLAGAAIASGLIFAIATTVQMMRARPSGKHRAG